MKQLNLIPIFLLLLLNTGSLLAHEFDGKRAFEDLEKQCDFGPRFPGTSGHATTLDWISAEFKKAGWHVEHQSFSADLAVLGKRETATNIWAYPVDPKEMDDQKGPIFVVSAHWDTRPIADNEPRGTRQRPFVGANDSGSGVAMILELARVLKETELGGHIVFLLFDAEDSGVSGDNSTWCLGSRYAANNLSPWFREKVRFGMNLDMVAGKDMKLSREIHSMQIAPGVVKRLWDLGRKDAPEIFSKQLGTAMIDDHVPFIEAGIPYIDLIGLPYPHWHRMSDVPKNCSADTLNSLGPVVIDFLNAELKR